MVPTFVLLIRKVMKTVSATSAPAVACAIDSAVTSVASAVAAAGPSGCMLAMASAFAENASRVALVLADSVNALTAKSF